jgi:hypothetical protein
LGGKVTSEAVDSEEIRYQLSNMSILFYRVYLDDLKHKEQYVYTKSSLTSQLIWHILLYPFYKNRRCSTVENLTWEVQAYPRSFRPLEPHPYDVSFL